MGYFNSFYIGNALLVLVYPVHRLLYNINSSSLYKKDTFGFTYENSIIYMMLTLLTLNYIRSYSMPQFVTDTFVLLKIMVFCFYTFVSINYAILYGMLCFFGWLLLSYPRYSGPHNFHKMKTIEEFQEKVEDDRPKGAPVKRKKKTEQKVLSYADKSMWFVEFYVDWAITCHHAREIWAEYSLRYATRQLRFASVNLEKLKDLSARYNINTSGLSRQLPTVIMFEDGQEVLRFPPIDQKTKKVSKVMKYESKALAKYFDLQQRYLQTRHTKDD